MALTDVAVRNAKPGAKAIKLADGGGMFLLVTPAGESFGGSSFALMGVKSCWPSEPIPKSGLARRAGGGRKRGN